jgi:hypothetical protein
MFTMVGTEHPTAKIRRTALLACISLALIMRDLWHLRELAAEARELERELRARHHQELEDGDTRHLERIADLHAQIAALRANGFAPAPAARRGDVDGQAVEVD